MERDDSELARIVDDLATRIARGERIVWSRLLAQHRKHAAALRELAPAIRLLAATRWKPKRFDDS